ncbi:hypothetical protein E4T66_10055 [Sinimarinibacterium sp. CAU 1509]|uniref:hypothetical protein n=1 Tax=Sinimarinibacterium sp. CAU 1509 TaxID=2562283 RepID=UPI0010AB91B1|nr:hypothetical protein [Sinimarinibacterium sp. CAU 1509]TJY60979.1 hypothetical protein E4T66_10055 [Sinimarinibacterium sp. CAU 1509]
MFSALVIFSLSASAAQPDLTERALRLDQNIQALKDEIIEFNREAQAVENETLVPDHLRLSVYLSVGVGGLLLTEAAITVDDKAPEIYRYDETDARALLDDAAVQRVLITTVMPGPHRIRMTVNGNFANAKPGDAPITQSYEAIFDKDDQEAELEFRLTRSSRFGGDLKLTMKQWKVKP